MRPYRVEIEIVGNYTQTIKWKFKSVEELVSESTHKLCVRAMDASDAALTISRVPMSTVGEIEVIEDRGLLPVWVWLHNWICCTIIPNQPVEEARQTARISVYDVSIRIYRKDAQ